MNVGVDATGRQDLALAGDRLRARADDDIDIRLHVRVARLADARDASVLQADIGLDDAPVIDDQRVGDDRIDRAAGARHLRLPHAVADHLAAAELHLLAVGGEVPFDLDEEFRIGKPHAVTRRGTEHVGIGRSRHLIGHRERLLSRSSRSAPVPDG